jgi:hypothetical protein
MKFTHLLINNNNKKQVLITLEEAQAGVVIPQDQSVILGRLGLSWQRRFCDFEPVGEFVTTNRQNQKTGILHDGTRVKRHFNDWVLNLPFYPDDNGVMCPILPSDMNMYPEMRLNKIASEEEYEMMQQNEINYYNFLGIDLAELCRLENGGSRELKEISDIIKSRVKKMLAEKNA